MNTLNRRKFLSSSALLATSSLITVTANAAAKDPMPAKWDEEADIIVVGSGFAGLAAAAEAKNANAGNVIVLEKMRAPGGNSVINGGIFAVPGNPAQVKLGIKDSPELLASDMIRLSRENQSDDRRSFTNVRVDSKRTRCPIQRQSRPGRRSLCSPSRLYHQRVRIRNCP